MVKKTKKSFTKHKLPKTITCLVRSCPGERNRTEELTLNVHVKHFDLEFDLVRSYLPSAWKFVPSLLRKLQNIRQHTLMFIH